MQSRWNGIAWTAIVLVGALLAAPAAAGKPLSQAELNHGYASLYQAARGLRHSDKIFLVKFESDAVQGVVEDLSGSMDRIAEDLQALAAADPRVKLDDDGNAEIEKRKREAVTRDRLMGFKPITGRTGRDFERTLLLSHSGALNQLQFLVSELDAADPDPQRSAMLQRTHRTVVRLYGEVVALLEREYFR